MTSEEMAAKIEALEVRLAETERTVAFLLSVTTEIMRGKAEAKPPLTESEAAEAIAEMTRAEAVNVVGGTLRPMLTICPPETRAELLRMTVVDALTAFCDGAPPPEGRETSAKAIIGLARKHALAWSDVGVTP